MNHPLPHPHHDTAFVELNRIPLKEDFVLLADIFKLLGDPTRLRLFWLLCHCEECVLNLSAMMEMSSPALSHHLKILKSCHLINSRREGKEVYYTVTKNPQTQALHESIKTIAQLTCPKDH